MFDVFIINNQRALVVLLNANFTVDISVDIKSILLFSSSSRERDVAQMCDGLILHGVDPLSYFSFQPVLHDRLSCLWDGAYKRTLAVNR